MQEQLRNTFDLGGQAERGGVHVTAAVPASRAGRGGASDADLLFDGLGPGGGATWPRLRDKLSLRIALDQGSGLSVPRRAQGATTHWECCVARNALT